jgi:hypothetical protein
VYPHLRRLDLTINHHLYVVLVLGYGHRWAAITITTVPRMIGQTPSEFLRLSVISCCLPGQLVSPAAGSRACCCDAAAAARAESMRCFSNFVCNSDSDSRPRSCNPRHRLCQRASHMASGEPSLRRAPPTRDSHAVANADVRPPNGRGSTSVCARSCCVCRCVSMSISQST